MSELNTTKVFMVVQTGCSGNHRSFFLLLCCHHRYRLPESRLFACCFLIVALRWPDLGVVWCVGLLLVFALGVAGVCRVNVAVCGAVLRGGRCIVSRGLRIKMACGVVVVRDCGR